MSKQMPEVGLSGWYPDGWVPGDDDDPQLEDEIERRVDKILDNLDCYDIIAESMGCDDVHGRQAQALLHTLVECSDRTQKTMTEDTWRENESLIRSSAMGLADVMRDIAKPMAYNDIMRGDDEYA